MSLEENRTRKSIFYNLAPSDYHRSRKLHCHDWDFYFVVFFALSEACDCACVDEGGAFLRGTRTSCITMFLIVCAATLSSNVLFSVKHF